MQVMALDSRRPPQQEGPLARSQALVAQLQQASLSSRPAAPHLQYCWLAVVLQLPLQLLVLKLQLLLVKSGKHASENNVKHWGKSCLKDFTGLYALLSAFANGEYIAAL